MIDKPTIQRGATAGTTCIVHYDKESESKQALVTCIKELGALLIVDLMPGPQLKGGTVSTDVDVELDLLDDLTADSRYGKYSKVAHYDIVPRKRKRHDDEPSRLKLAMAVVKEYTQAISGDDEELKEKMLKELYDLADGKFDLDDAMRKLGWDIDIHRR